MCNLVINGEFEKYEEYMPGKNYKKINNCILNLNSDDIDFLKNNIELVNNLNIEKLFVIIDVELDQNKLINLENYLKNKLKKYNLNNRSLFVNDILYENGIKRIILEDMIKSKVLTNLYKNISFRKLDIIFILLIFILLLVVICDHIYLKNQIENVNSNSIININIFKNEIINLQNQIYQINKMDEFLLNLTENTDANLYDTMVNINSTLNNEIKNLNSTLISEIENINSTLVNEIENINSIIIDEIKFINSTLIFINSTLTNQFNNFNLTNQIEEAILNMEGVMKYCEKKTYYGSSYYSLNFIKYNGHDIYDSCQ